MYCKECGQPYQNETSMVCLYCGVKKGNGKNYCDQCGELKKSENQDVCLKCGKEFKRSILTTNGSKTILITLILWFFLGAFGGHQFYAGHTGKGILYICLTLLGVITFGITAIIVFVLLIVDLINILTGKFKDKDGLAITQWT